MTTSLPRRSAECDGQTRAGSELAARCDHGPETAAGGGGGGSTLTRGDVQSRSRGVQRDTTTTGSNKYGCAALVGPQPGRTCVRAYVCVRVCV